MFKIYIINSVICLLIGYLLGRLYRSLCKKIYKNEYESSKYIKKTINYGFWSAIVVFLLPLVRNSTMSIYSGDAGAFVLFFTMKLFIWIFLGAGISILLLAGYSIARKINVKKVS